MSNEYRSKNLDHLGIVSQICDDIGIVEAVDKMIPPDPNMKLSHGECIKLMVINGLGFTSRPLYLEAQFFSSRAVKRIIALAMVMCLCLLVYTIAQRYLRQRLEQARACVPNQLGKATRTPTMRWIFQLFEGVHLLIRKTQDKTEEIILNMNPIRCHVLAILGPPFQKMYGGG